jgi:hypothetical protein
MPKLSIVPETQLKNEVQFCSDIIGKAKKILRSACYRILRERSKYCQCGKGAFFDHATHEFAAAGSEPRSSADLI